MTDLHMSKEDIMKTFINRRSFVAGVAGIAFARSIAPLSAQEVLPESIVEFVETFVSMYNNGDQAVTNLAIPDFFVGESFRPIELYNVEPIVGADGALSAIVSYSGYLVGNKNLLLSEEWFITPGPDDSFFLSGYAPVEEVVFPEEATTGNLDVTIGDVEFTLDPLEVSEVDFQVVSVTNTGTYTYGIVFLQNTEEHMAMLQKGGVILPDSVHAMVTVHAGNTQNIPVANLTAGEWLVGGIGVNNGQAIGLPQYVTTFIVTATDGATPVPSK